MDETRTHTLSTRYATCRLSHPTTYMCECVWYRMNFSSFETTGSSVTRRAISNIHADFCWGALAIPPPAFSRAAPRRS